ncbi:hypothetical protein SAY87_007133 [Trapa incisa]|uniref:Uncharacterized protein n=1 Tax=Trapa incisa TaxID=236973 RepID=A0AAN7Q004_9MYRT|nr:hypothetical protein SAY87_007133 [Trapa incisa]
MKAESGDTESVTVRLFGTNTDYVINRERELQKQELTGRLNSPVVYAHNDLLCGNVMVNDEEGTDHWQGQIDTSENDGAVTCPTCLRELSMVEATKTDHEQQ